MEADSQIVAQAQEAAADAFALRRTLRRQVKPGPARDRRIIPALNRLDDAAKPLRSVIGRLAYENLSQRFETDARLASAAIQAERRQLKKMLRGPRL